MKIYDILFDEYDLNSSISLWDYISIKKIDNCSDYRIYYKPYSDDINEKLGFDFLVVCDMFNIDVEDNFECEKIFKGYALYDGIRHLYCGCNSSSEFDGYIFYPELLKLCEVFKELRLLEEKYCYDI